MSLTKATNSQFSYGCIYKITNTINGKCYVGQTIQKPEKRWRCHLKIYKNTFTSLIQWAIAKYGQEKFLFEVVCYSYNQQELNGLEDKFIVDFNALAPFGYTCIGSRDRSSEVSSTTRANMSKARIGRVPWNKGKSYQMPESSRINYKMGNKHKCLGKLASQETKQKQSLAKKGNRFLSDEHYRKIAILNTGRKHSIEAKSNMSKARMGMRFTETHNRNISLGRTKFVYKRVNPIDKSTKLYYSAKEIEAAGFRYSCVVRICCKMPNLKHKKYNWLREVKNDHTSN